MEKGLEKAGELLLNISLAHGTGLSSDEIKNAPEEILRKHPELNNYDFIDPNTTGQGTMPVLLVESYEPLVLGTLEKGNAKERNRLASYIFGRADYLIKVIKHIIVEEFDDYIKVHESQIQVDNAEFHSDIARSIFRIKAIRVGMHKLEQPKRELLVLKAILEYSRNENHKAVAEKIAAFLNLIESARQEALRKLEAYSNYDA